MDALKLNKTELLVESIYIYCFPIKGARSYDQNVGKKKDDD